MTLSQHSNLNTILVLIYCFVDDFLKDVLANIHHALMRPKHDRPPTNLSVANWYRSQQNAVRRRRIE
jgi:hypothetical protein